MQQIVGILHLVRVTVMRSLQLGVSQQVPHLGGDSPLSWVRTGVVVRPGKRHVRAQQRLKAHGPDHRCRPRERFRSEHGEGADGRHLLRAVEQRQSFLRLEPKRLQFDPAEGFRARQHLAVHFRLTPADERAGKVGQRSQVA